MFPQPFLDFIPQFIRDDPTADFQPFVDYMDQYLTALISDIRKVDQIYNAAAAMSNVVVDELGYFLAAGLLPIDSDREKREKVQTAVQGHKQRGTWLFDAKPKIDIIAGGDSSIFKQALVTDDDSIVMGGEATEPDSYWSVFGTDGIDANGGIFVVGDGTEVILAGNIYVDTDNAFLTQTDVAQLREAFVDLQPVYYQVFFGYVIGGIFFKYVENFQNVVTTDGKQVVTSDGHPVRSVIQ